MTNADGSTGFFGSLFDFTFSNFITTKLVPVLYGLGLLVAGIMALFFILGGFSQGSGMGLLFLVLSPLVFLFAAMQASFDPREVWERTAWAEPRGREVRGAVTDSPP